MLPVWLGIWIAGAIMTWNDYKYRKDQKEGKTTVEIMWEMPKTK